MKEKELLKQVEDAIGADFIAEGVHNVNWKVDGLPGHPFTIGARHVAHAADHHCGRLGQETLDAIPCAAQGCHRPHSAHTSDKVLFLKLRRNLANKEAGAALFKIKPLMLSEKIDGICFVDTPEKFRVAPAEVA